MRAKLTFLAENSAPPAYGPSVGGADAYSDLVGTYETREVDVLNGRELDPPDLDREGFRLVQQRSSVTDFYDEAQRTQLYEAECQELVARASGAVRTHVFDHTLRADNSARREQKNSREPSSFVHCDYTVRSGPQRVRELMGSEAEMLLQRPVAIINVWRPIRLVESSPLAVCDARTVKVDSLVPAERRAANRIGEIYMARYDPGQRWVYFPRMVVDEVLLIKTYDSREDGRARWCPHTSFEDHGAKPGAPARESIESRVMAFFASG